MPEMKLKFERINFNNINSIVDYGKEIYDSFNDDIMKMKKKASLEELVKKMLMFTDDLEVAYNIGVIDRQAFISNNYESTNVLEKQELIDLFDYKLKFIFNNIDVWRSLLINKEIEPFRKKAIVEILLESINPSIKEKDASTLIGWLKKRKYKSRKN